MTVFDLALIYEYWSAHPPADMILAAVHGVKPNLAPELAASREKDEIARIKGLFESDKNLVKLRDFSVKHQGAMSAPAA